MRLVNLFPALSVSFPNSLLGVYLGACIGVAGLVLILPTTVFASQTAVAETAGLWVQIVAWVYSEQRAFHVELTNALRAIARDGFSAAWTLIVASFLYGVFHAAGPGHGKVILTAYLATQPENAKRGIFLSIAAALCQGLSAIVIVYGLVSIAGWIPSDASAAVRWSERASYMLVVALGGVLAFRALSSAWARIERKRRHDHGHSSAGHTHNHASEDEADACGCGHVHVANPEQTAKRGWKSTISVILSIGLRPCTGAVLVLVFAQISKLDAAGLAAVLAMSLGTALTVSTLAMIAISARTFATRTVAKLNNRQNFSFLGYSGDAAALIGGTVIAAMGVSLLIATIASTHPLGLS